MARHRNIRNEDYDEDYYDSDEYDDPLASYGTPHSPSISQFMYKNHDSKYQLKVDQKNDYNTIINNLLDIYPNLLDDFELENLKKKIEHYNYDLEQIQIYISNSIEQKNNPDAEDQLFELEQDDVNVGPSNKVVEKPKNVVDVTKVQNNLNKKPNTPKSQPKVSTPKSSGNINTPTKIGIPKQPTSNDSAKKPGEDSSSKPKKKVKQMSDSTRETVLAQLNSSKDKLKLNTVVIGHVDSGKSTTLGHLLYLSGKIDNRTLQTFERQSKDIGKSSFQYAWILDQGQEERDRGVTVDIAAKTLQTEKFDITFMDCPGHKDFIHNMISGTSQAESCVLVIDSSEDGVRILKGDKNQTKEHALLARTLGITQVIVAINKLDLSDWNQEHYNTTVEVVRQLLKQIGFKEQNVTFIPCSGFLGENLYERKEPKLSWFEGPTLIQALNNLQPPKRYYEKPLRMSVSDSFKDSTGGLGYTISGIIESGFVNKGDNLMIMPSRLICSVKGIRVDGNMTQTAFAGQNVDIGVIGIEGDITNGSVICDPENPISVTSKFMAQIRTFELATPLIKGCHVMIYTQQIVEPARIILFDSLVERDGKKKRPRMIGDNKTAIVKIETENLVCVDTYSSQGAFGRFVLRVDDLTIGAGIIMKIEEN